MHDEDRRKRIRAKLVLEGHDPNGDRRRQSFETELWAAPSYEGVTLVPTAAATGTTIADGFIVETVDLQLEEAGP